MWCGVATSICIIWTDGSESQIGNFLAPALICNDFEEGMQFKPVGQRKKLEHPESRGFVSLDKGAKMCPAKQCDGDDCKPVS